MKYFKIIWVVFFLFPLMSGAQPALHDKVLLGLRTAYNAQITAITIRRDAVKDSYERLEKEEKKFIAKLKGVKNNPKYAALLLAVEDKLLDVNTIYNDIETDLLPLTHLPLYANIFSELENEKKYLDEITDDLDVLDVFSLEPKHSGGLGYSINYLMKVYLRGRMLESRLLELQYRTANLGVLNNIY